MKIVQRISILIAISVSILASGLLVNSMVAAESAIASNEIQAPQLTATPPADPFSATVHIDTSAIMLSVGESLTVTVDLEVVEGCQYPVYELMLFQDGADAPLFAYVNPATATVGPGVSMPFTYVLTATNSGMMNFRAQTYGERNCNDYWNWRYLSAESGTITVLDGPPTAINISEFSGHQQFYPPIFIIGAFLIALTATSITISTRRSH